VTMIAADLMVADSWAAGQMGGAGLRTTAGRRDAGAALKGAALARGRGDTPADAAKRLGRGL
jgi:hypothetical protein